MTKPLAVGTKVRVNHGSFAGQVGVISEVHGDVYVLNYDGPRLWGAETIDEWQLLTWFKAEVIDDGR